VEGIKKQGWTKVVKLAELRAIEKQLGAFVEEFAGELGRAERRTWGKRYVMGLVLDGERKSIEPLAQRVPGGNEQALQQFVNQSPWAHEPVQTKLYRRLIKRSGPGRGVLILDDTTLPKKGKASVGVAPQYCGALGKVANCQAIVTWHYSGSRMHFPLLGELYLPEAWTADRQRLRHAGVPPEKWQFQEKWKLALALLDQFRAELSYEAMVMDAGNGEIRAFLQALDERGQLFVAQIPESHCFWPATIALEERSQPGGRPRHFPMIADPRAQPLSAKAWRVHADAGKLRWQKVRLPLQRRKPVTVVAVRVRETVSQAWRRPGPERWLFIERHRDGTCKYYLSNAPVQTSVTQMLGWAHQRWKIEQGYQQLKEELGLDHFEGRSWRGLHHHLTLCFLAYGFLQLLRQKKKRAMDAAGGPPLAQPLIQLYPVSILSSISSRTVGLPL
jgi:SRSO17 transposase